MRKWDFLQVFNAVIVFILGCFLFHQNQFLEYWKVLVVILALRI